MKNVKNDQLLYPNLAWPEKLFGTKIQTSKFQKFYIIFLGYYIIFLGSLQIDDITATLGLTMQFFSIIFVSLFYVALILAERY